MKPFLIDSDVLIDFFKRKQPAVALLEKLGEEGQLVISVLSVAELRSGWSEQDAGMYLSRLYNLAEVLPVTMKIAEQAGTLREAYRRKGTLLPTIDVLIAATAMLNACCLVTRNKKDYPLHGLDLYPIE